MHVHAAKDKKTRTTAAQKTANVLAANPAAVAVRIKRHVVVQHLVVNVAKKSVKTPNAAGTRATARIVAVVKSLVVVKKVKHAVVK